MENTDDSQLQSNYKKLLAENTSLQAMLEGYTGVIRSRDNEIAILQTMVTEAHKDKSDADNQLKELKGLQGYINDLKQQVTGSVYLVTGKQQQVVPGIGAEQHLEELKKDYAVLQSELSALQNQLQQVNTRNLQLQLMSSRVAELESLLENYQQNNSGNDT